jgi:hypothetical protein
MTNGQVVAITDEWVDLTVAANRLGFDSATLLRLIQEGDFPAIQVRGKGRKRTAHRVPADLIEKARRIVFAGGQVELREFARQWAAQNVKAVA